MAESLFEREHSALARLRSLIVERAAGEACVAATWQQAADEAEKEVAKARKQIAASRKKATDEREAAYEELASGIIKKYDSRQTAADQKRIEELKYSLGKFEEANEKTRAAYKDRLWTVDSLFEAGEREADDELQKQVRKAEAGRRRADSAWAGVDPVLDRVGVTRADIAFPEEHLPPPTVTDPDGYMVKKLEELEVAGDRVANAFGPKLLRSSGIIGLGILAAALAASSFAFTSSINAALITGVGGFALAGGFYLLARLFAKRQIRRLGSAFGVYHAESSRAVRLLGEYAHKAFERAKADLVRRHANDKKRTDDHFQPLLAQILKTKETEFETIESQHDDKTNQIGADRQTETRATDAAHEVKLKEITTKHDADAKTAEERYQIKWQAAAAERDRDWTAMANAWQTGLAEVQATVTDLIAIGQRAFPNWDTAQQSSWPLPLTVPDGVRYGELNVDMYSLPDGEPMDARLTPANPIRTLVPAYLPFPDKASVLLKADDRGRPAAITAVQAMMLRFLTGLPPGKVRFTIIDPVGLGENFASFMHLADYDEKLVGARIWTEPRQIDQRLTDMTEHMENVIQKYLRNQYKSIEDYNRAAGEVAEPYRVLVIANFPVNFTPESARRLISIMSSGPACGVCTLVTCDTKAPLPRDFRLADLEQVAFNLHWKENHFVPVDADLNAFPLSLDVPPEGPATAAIIRRVGEASREAGRVEVPFDFIMPTPEKVWTGDATKGFEVPIGRAGATKRQVLTLGRGTAQHALIAGKTGSGKSTLLHALITNLALNYGPDQAELYLIDFKKGVEFKMYAALRLPHARVVAIESEREFGLSVLQRLDGILRERGESFRQVGANDLAGYRDATGTTLPRILFVVDEFQEFFVEDDKLSSEAALLLDRLVRQGRAFGLHVLLGSQTLGGAYSLARSTIDQMAVRIALQCSDADAQLILSKDNNAARLLSRPGEAIYNDANGLVEGNNPFQVVWLDEDRREQILSGLRERSNGAYPPPLVFEGNLPAVLSDNKLLKEVMAHPPREAKSVTAWLGDAIAIKDPTAAVFRAQSAANLLMVGQQEEAALALIVASVVSLLPQVPTREFTILDGTPDDAEHAEYLRRATTALGIPEAVIDRSQIPTAIANLFAEFERRQKNETPERSPRFLIVHGLSRFRELRKPEDDFGFGRKGEGAKPPGELFATMLRDGPALGIHTILWCDSLTNFNRALDRQALREFGQRVLFQMSATDSSHLLDTPAANRLDRNRALFTLEDQPRPEKFRPYGLPEIEWLKTLK
jgi:hypothetical protein